MKITTGNAEFHCTDFLPDGNSVRFILPDAQPETLGDAVDLQTDTGVSLRIVTVADYTRHYIDGTALVLTNTPEPEPEPDPEPVEPSAEEQAAAQIATLKAELSSTDYQIIKCSECSLSNLDAPYDIAALHTSRQAIRDQINALQATLTEDATA